MSLPRFVGSATGTADDTSKEITYASITGNLLLVGVALNDGSSSVLGISDDAGLDSTSSPINKWSLISANTFNGTRLEVWGCRAAVAISNLTVVLAATQEMTILVAEYSGNTFVSPTQAQVSRGQNPTVSEDIVLYISEPPPNSSCILVGFFSALGDSITGVTSSSIQASPAGGTFRADAVESSPLPFLALVDQGVSDANGDGQLTVGVHTSTLAESSPTDNVAASSLQGIAIILSSGLVLTQVPGFSDLADSAIAAGQNALGVHLGKIAQNASFGMVRLETFTGTYKNGDTIPLPVSSADGYQYSRDELIYKWGISTSANPATGWLTGPDALWYCAWLVDQTSGLVSTVEWYRRSGDHANPAQSNDGVLSVIVYAQRKQSSLIIATPPIFKDTDTTIYVQDAAYTQGMLQDLNHNAKFSVVNVEVIYMGEFVNGDTIPHPVSPADGYEYSYDEVAFSFSWRWTTLNSLFTQPDMSLGQLGPMKASINASTGAVSVSVAYIGNGGDGPPSAQTGHGRIGVFALCARSRLTSFIVPVTAFDGDGTIADFQEEITLNVVAGHSYNISASGEVTVYYGSSSSFTVGPDGEVSTSWDWGLQSGCLVGLWLDSSGAAIGEGFSPGTSDTVSAPSGAVNLLLGCNTADGTAANPATYPLAGGEFTVIVIDTSISIPLANSFYDIDSSNFLPGSLVPASVMETIDLNAKEAALNPELFGPTDYADGDTVPLPVSSIDGYKYSRTELTYDWEWSDTSNQTGDHLREAVFFGTIDSTSGLVTLRPYRLPPGGAPVLDGASNARITVTVIASRQSQLGAISAPSVNPPSDVSTILADLSSGTITVDGT